MIDYSDAAKQYAACGGAYQQPLDNQQAYAMQALLNAANTAFDNAYAPSKLDKAKEKLGNRYVFHKDYKPQPAHNFSKFPGSYFLAPIRAKAIAAGRLLP
jgi:hypothetical protein